MDKRLSPLIGHISMTGTPTQETVDAINRMVEIAYHKVKKRTVKFIPILFQTLMVQATLPGRKTMTRRLKGLEIINEAPGDWLLEKFETNAKGGTSAVFTQQKDNELHYSVPCPYGKPGDVLWGRETFCEPWLYDGCENDYYYKATDDECDRHIWPTRWKPSIHMPKTACRIFLEITNITVERLQDISEAEAIAEGVELYHDSTFYVMYGSKDNWCATAYASFAYLWETINGVESWDANPWAWVISFKKIERPVNFI